MKTVTFLFENLTQLLEKIKKEKTQCYECIVGDLQAMQTLKKFLNQKFFKHPEDVKTQFINKLEGFEGYLYGILM